MGHTHYWTWGAFINKEDYMNALKDCRKIIKASPVPLTSGSRDSKHGPRLRNGFCFNGVGKDGCTPFSMGPVPNREELFCKTYERPYDMIVVACLCAIQDCIGEEFYCRSDGDPHEWEKGRQFAEQVLGRNLEIPQGVRDQPGTYAWAAKQYREEHPEYEYTPLEVTHPKTETEVY